MLAGKLLKSLPLRSKDPSKHKMLRLLKYWMDGGMESKFAQIQEIYTREYKKKILLLIVLKYNKQ